jgi:hypothetical protein
MKVQLSTNGVTPAQLTSSGGVGTGTGTAVVVDTLVVVEYVVVVE